MAGRKHSFKGLKKTEKKRHGRKRSHRVERRK